MWCVHVHVCVCVCVCVCVVCLYMMRVLVCVRYRVCVQLKCQHIPLPFPLYLSFVPLSFFRPSHLSAYSSFSLFFFFFSPPLLCRLAGTYDKEAVNARIDATLEATPVVMFSFSTCPFCLKVPLNPS